MKNILLLSTLLLIGCAESGFQVAQQPRPNPGIGPEFAPFVKQFEADYGRSIGNFPIIFGDQDGNVIGVCKIWSDGYRQIEIDPTYWNNLNVSDAERKALMYHELGHCILNRGHDPTMVSSSFGTIPRSIMNPYLMSALSWVELQAYYISELFNNPIAVPLSETNNGCIEYIQN